MAKLNRSNFLKKENTVYGIDADLVSNDFEKYNFLYPMTYYRIKEDDVGRPDVISLKLYGTIDFWWLLMKFNRVDDVWNELYIGQVIKVPDVRDFTQYVNRYLR